jgi:hypothetical protein
MRNILILGSGRSGTSMIAGTLARAGYYMGSRLVPPRDSNPKGFFEDHEINDINETVLKHVVPHRPRYIGRILFRHRLGYMQKWLARVPVGTPIPTPQGIERRIQEAVQHEPYCFKDPRLSYTLPVWRPHLRNTVFICVFRDPASTAMSIVKECRQPYLRRLNMDTDTALEIWQLMYRHILEIHCREGKWLFLHFNEALQSSGLDRLEEFTGATVDRTFPDPALRRSVSHQPVPPKVWETYRQLCALAGYAIEDLSRS